MAETSLCYGNKLQDDGDNHWSFHGEPMNEDGTKVVGKWFSTVIKSVANCELVKFEVTQDCEDCQVKSPYGVLTDKRDVLEKQRGRYTYVWTSPKKPDQCNFKATSPMPGQIYNTPDPKKKIIRDENRQVEFVVHTTENTVCEFKKALKVVNIPHTYIELDYKVSSNDLTAAGSELDQFYSVGMKDTAGSPVLMLGFAEPNYTVGAKVKLVERSDKSRLISVNFVLNKTGDTVIKTQYGGTCLIPEKGELFLRKCAENDGPYRVLIKTSELGVININGKCIESDKRKMAVFAKDCSPKAQKWALFKLDSEQNDQAETEEIAHRQYIEGVNTRHANIIQDEISQLACDVNKIKHNLIMSIAQYSPILAGRAIDLPVCQRIVGKGQSLVVEQCKSKTISLNEIAPIKTVCATEPIWDNKTVSSDGFTEIDFRPCVFDKGIVNFNGKSFHYDNSSWKELKPQIQLRGIGEATHFEEIEDNEYAFLHNLEVKEDVKRMDQLSVMSELVSFMANEEISSVTPVLYAMSETTHQMSFLNWFSGLSYTLLCVACILIIIVILFCVGKCPSVNIIKKREAEGVAEAPPRSPKRKRTRKEDVSLASVQEESIQMTDMGKRKREEEVPIHNHEKVKFDVEKGRLVYSDGCHYDG
jgi:hypothetical protein